MFEHAYPALRRYAHYRGLRSSDADDLVADVFTIAWRRLGDVPADDPTPWLFAVARNVWRNHLRSAARRTALVERLRERDVAYAADPTDSPAVAEIRRAMSSLSEDDQELLRLVAWEGLTPAQVAVVLGCSSTAARVRLHRARARFSKHLNYTETRHAPLTGLYRERRSEEVSDEQSNAW